MIYSFENNLTLRDTTIIPVTAATAIEREPMVYNASAYFAYGHGGDLTRQFLDELKILWRDTGRSIIDEPFVIDTRVHMLKPGWLPAIGGWHCDGVPRGKDGQPELWKLQSDDRHFTMTIATSPTLSRTAFLNTPAVVFSDPKSGSVWADVHEDLSQVTNPKSIVHVPHGMIAEFRRDTLHKATKADHDGWRFFIRASYRPGSTTTNKIRRQVQAYIESEGAGW